MTEHTVSFSVGIVRTPAPSPHSPYPQVMLLLAVLARVRSFALALAVAAGAGGELSWSLGLELRDGPVSVAAWIPGRNSLPVGVVQGGTRLPGFGWGQLVALSTDLSPAPRGVQWLSSPLDQVTFRSAGGRWGPELKPWG